MDLVSVIVPVYNVEKYLQKGFAFYKKSPNSQYFEIAIKLYRNRTKSY